MRDFAKRSIKIRLEKKPLGMATSSRKTIILKKDIEYTKAELLNLFHKDLEKAREGANQLVGHISELHIEAKNCIIEMVFQLGTQGTRNFKKLILALEEKDYFEAHVQMLDSRWS